jgi:hypothetical protein
MPALRADADLVEKPSGARPAFGVWVPEQLREIDEQFLGGEVIVEERIFRQVADVALRFHVADRPAENLAAARRGIDQLHQQLERRRLARAVRAEEADDFSRFDVEGEAIEGAVRPLAPEADGVVLGQLEGGQSGRHATFIEDGRARTRLLRRNTAA